MGILIYNYSYIRYFDTPFHALLFPSLPLSPLQTDNEDIKYRSEIYSMSFWSGEKHI